MSKKLESSIALSQVIQPEGAQPITVAGLGDFTVATTSRFTETRDAALADAALILEVNSAEDQEQAIETVSVLKGVMKAVEASRTAVKKPVLELGALIDTRAKEFTREAAAESARIEGLISKFQAAERERLRREEAARQKAEADRLAAEQKTNEAHEGDDLAASLEADLAAPAPSAPVAVIAPVAKAEGAAVARKLSFEVTDIAALYEYSKAHCPAVPLVSLTENRSNIAATLKFLGLDKAQEIPGLRVFEEDKVAVRAARL